MPQEVIKSVSLWLSTLVAYNSKFENVALNTLNTSLVFNRPGVAGAVL